MAKHMTGGRGVSSANKLARCLQERKMATHMCVHFSYCQHKGLATGQQNLKMAHNSQGF